MLQAGTIYNYFGNIYVVIGHSSNMWLNDRAFAENWISVFHDFKRSVYRRESGLVAGESPLGLLPFPNSPYCSPLCKLQAMVYDIFSPTIVSKNCELFGWCSGGSTFVTYRQLKINQTLLSFKWLLGSTDLTDHVSQFQVTTRQYWLDWPRCSLSPAQIKPKVVSEWRQNCFSLLFYPGWMPLMFTWVLGR